MSSSLRLSFSKLIRRRFSSESKNTGFFQKFADAAKNQGKDEDLQTSVKRFEETLTEIKGLESVKKAKEIFEKAKADAAKQNEALLSEVKEKVNTVKDVAGKVSSTVGYTLNTAAKPIKAVGEIVKPYVPNISETELAQKLGKKVSETEESLLESTNVYRYGGYKSKEARERTKLKLKDSQESETTQVSPESIHEAVPENPNAGEALVMHKTSKLSQLWEEFKENNALSRNLHGLKRRYDESNNVFVFFMREFTGGISSRVGSLFAETETAKAMREISLRDPTFSIERFMKDAHEYLIPEILDALLAADLPTLRLWTTEAAFNMLKATFDSQLKVGHRMEGRVLDLRHIEVVTAKVLDDTPVIVVTFTTQQISYVKDQTGKLVEGSEDGIENVNYVMALAKQEKVEKNSPTKGWKLLEIAIRPGGGW